MGHWRPFGMFIALEHTAAMGRESGWFAASTIICEGSLSAPFVRGDANQDGTYNVSDGVAIAKALFHLGSKYPLIERCTDSADTDDDGDVDRGDAVYLLKYLFLEGDPILAPLGSCGQDPTPDAFRCEAFDCP